MKDLIWKNKSCLTKEGLLSACPNCQESKLSLTKYGEQITNEGKDLEQNGYPFGIEHHFIGFLTCLNKDCNHLITLAGIVQKDIHKSGQDAFGQYFDEEFDNYIPHYYSPNIRYFKLTSKVPKIIRETIDLAFYHYFFDNNASANKIRIAIELILDDIKAPKKKWNASKTKMIQIINLHQRIENFSKKQKSLATLMLANKYIGNDGSHIGNVVNEELLDAFDNLEEIVDRIYIKKSKQLISKANKLIEERKYGR